MVDREGVWSPEESRVEPSGTSVHRMRREQRPAARARFVKIDESICCAHTEWVGTRGCAVVEVDDGTAMAATVDRDATDQRASGASSEAPAPSARARRQMISAWNAIMTAIITRISPNPPSSLICKK